MSDYLSNYLKVLPDYEADSLRAALLADNKQDNHVNQSEYASIINNLNSLGEMITELVTVTANIDKVSRDQFNKYYLGVYMDILRLYKESALIESALNNYDYFHINDLHNLEAEIEALTRRINEIDNNASTRETIVTIVENFSTSRASSMESRAQYEYLYKDRDGRDIPKAEIKSEGTKSRLTTSERANKDLLRNEESGLINAVIAVTDRRGDPVPQTQHPVELALDNNMSTYWGEMILTDKEISSSMTEGDYLIPSGGALARVNVKLSKVERVSEIILVPFSPYPLTISAVFAKNLDGSLIPIMGSEGYMDSAKVNLIRKDAVGSKDASIIDANIPANMVGGQSYQVSITVKNTGSTIWSEEEAYKLGAVGDYDPLTKEKDWQQTLNAGERVLPGESRTFSFTMHAPMDTLTYTTEWRMLCEASGWFGESASANVKVIIPSNKISSSSTAVLETAADVDSVQIIQCNSIKTDELIIYLRQKNYVDNTYLIMDNMDSSLWNKIGLAEMDYTWNKFNQGSQINMQLTQDMIDAIDGWADYMAIIEALSSQITSTVDEQEDEISHPNHRRRHHRRRHNRHHRNHVRHHHHHSHYQHVQQRYNDNSEDPRIASLSPKLIKWQGYYYSPYYNISGNIEEIRLLLASIGTYYGPYTDAEGHMYVYLRGESDGTDYYTRGGN